MTTKQYIKAKYVGPTNTKGSRIIIEQLRGFGEGNGKRRSVGFQSQYNDTCDQLRAKGWIFLFEDKTHYFFERELA